MPIYSLLEYWLLYAISVQNINKGDTEHHDARLGIQYIHNKKALNWLGSELLKGIQPTTSKAMDSVSENRGNTNEKRVRDIAATQRRTNYAEVNSQTDSTRVSIRETNENANNQLPYLCFYISSAMMGSISL